MGLFDGITEGRWARDKQFKNIWEGRPAIIIGRGPRSEYKIIDDVSEFKGKRIGCNTAYRAYSNLDALVWMDYDFFRDNRHELKHLKCYKFAVNPVTYQIYGMEIYGIEAHKPERCSESLDTGMFPCNLTGYVALNLALIMGLNPIWLHGFDANYKDQKMKERLESFALIAEWCKKNNREVFVATESSGMERFFTYKRLPAIKHKRLKSGSRRRGKELSNNDMGTRV